LLTKIKVCLVSDTFLTFVNKKNDINANSNLEQFGKKEARPKTRHRQTEACTYWRERGNCRWTGRPTERRRPKSNTSFNTPDISRDGSNTA